MAPVPGVAGILLTGGRSRRMGTDKSALVLPGDPRTLLERARATLSAVTAPVVEVGPEVGGGPLAAVAAGGNRLTADGHHGPALVLAVDMPNVPVAMLELLAGYDGNAVPVADGHAQPLCARYAASALARAATLVASGSRSMHDLLEAIDFAAVAPDEWGAVAPPDAFVDLDTPDDLPGP